MKTNGHAEIGGGKGVFSETCQAKSTGRPRNEAMPMANSMLQVKAWTAMPVELIKSLKQEGCQAFESGGRVRTGPLLRFFFEQYWDEVEKPPDGLATWREALNRVQTHRQEILLDKDKGKTL